MQTIILAAGMGKRLRHKTESNTKCMVYVNGHRMIDRSLDNVTKHPINRIVMVVGYEGEKVKQHLGDSFNGVPIIYVDNPVYATTNNIYSLALAADYLAEDDTILLESDLVYESSIIDKLLAHPFPNVAVVDKYNATMDGTVVEINEDNDITAFIPKKHFDYRKVDSYYKTVNIYKFSREFLVNNYIPFLKAYSQALGNNQYYEQVLRVLLSLEQNNLKAMPLNGEKWYEIDDLQDLSNAELMFTDDKPQQLQLYQKRFGGYWRFHGFLDYCYLVNPYFPPKRMIEEYKYSFVDLLINYPSGQNTQNLLAANCFDCLEENILVGNGAAELITALMQSIPGRIAVHYPTFQEYPARIEEKRLVKLHSTPPPYTFRYTAKDMLAAAPQYDWLLLINPDNPSGNFIPKDEVLHLAEALKEQGKGLILDESFVDFSSEGTANTFIHQAIIDQLPNLVIIKSISKSYGVPGIRLGIMVTGDTTLLAATRAKMSIWNINSFGEYFLQTLPKYSGAYAEACARIARVRDDFGRELSRIPYLRVLPSQANYFLCEVLPPLHSTQLCEIMLSKYNILLKDCSTKSGFDGASFIRVAVKSEEENEFLIEKLLHLSVLQEGSL